MFFDPSILLLILVFFIFDESSKSNFIKFETIKLTLQLKPTLLLTSILHHRIQFPMNQNNFYWVVKVSEVSIDNFCILYILHSIHKYLPNKNIIFPICIGMKFEEYHRDVYVPVISKTLEHIKTFNTNYIDSS